MRVKHGTMIKLTYKTGRKVIDTHIVPVEHMDSDMTVFSVTHGNVSGHVNWNHLGKPIGRPKVKIALVNSEDELTGDQECDCERCVA